MDAFPKKLEGEGMDYCQGSVFLDNPRIDYDTGGFFFFFVKINLITN